MATQFNPESILDTEHIRRSILDIVRERGPRVVGTSTSDQKYLWYHTVDERRVIEYSRADILDPIVREVTQNLASSVIEYRERRGPSVLESMRNDTLPNGSTFSYALPVFVTNDPANRLWRVEVRDYVEPSNLTDFVAQLDRRLKEHIGTGRDIKPLADDCRFALEHAWDESSIADLVEYVPMTVANGPFSFARDRYRATDRSPPTRYDQCFARLRDIAATVFLLESAQARRGSPT